jgi:hypothetical protein
MPTGIINRAADNWRPLLAIAETAGEVWAKRARDAAEASHNAEGDDGSRLELLLGDIRAAFGTDDEMPSADLVKALVELDGRPWAEMGRSRKPLTQNRLARMLKPLGIAPENVRVGDKVPKCYVLARFEEAFARYLPPDGASEPLHRHKADGMDTSDLFQTATPEPDVADRQCEKPANDGACSGVADGKGDQGQHAHAGDGNGLAPGLSPHTITDLAEAYNERAYANAQENEGDTRTVELDAWLRQRLADEMVLPEFVETEFRRIMDEVFRV